MYQNNFIVLEESQMLQTKGKCKYKSTRENECDRCHMLSKQMSVIGAIC